MITVLIYYLGFLIYKERIKCWTHGFHLTLNIYFSIYLSTNSWESRTQYSSICEISIESFSSAFYTDYKPVNEVDR